MLSTFCSQIQTHMPQHYQRRKESPKDARKDDSQMVLIADKEVNLVIIDKDM